MALVIIAFLLLISKCTVSGFRCDRRPYGTIAQSSQADGRFILQIVGEHTAYLPDQLYIVKIVATDETSRFIGFMISAEGDLTPDPQNPRRMISLYPGGIRPQSSTTSKFSDRCLYSVEQAVNSYKESVEVYWQAPPTGSGCVTLRAMVVENDNVWFEGGTPLTLKICEDVRQPDDLALQINMDCQVCDEAKYEISFTGIWSRLTHPRFYPENDWILRYSDLVGASHTDDFVLWSPGTEATDGLRQLAEHANSSALEKEILEKIGNGTRTLIKGQGHSALKMNLTTYAFFRSDKSNHLLSVAVALSPSPDWFLGVARFELCQTNNTWLPERELNLFPWDAGTDSGVSYESPNFETFPKDAVTRVQMSSYDKSSPFYEMDIKDLYPFGRLRIELVKTYHRECEETTESEDKAETTEGANEVDEENESKESGSEPEKPSRYQNPNIGSSDNGGIPYEGDGSDSKEEPVPDCRTTAWGKWSECEGVCEDGVIKGYKWRLRDYISTKLRKNPSAYCKKNFPTFEFESCEQPCSDS